MKHEEVEINGWIMMGKRLGKRIRVKDFKVAMWNVLLYRPGAQSVLLEDFFKT